MPDTLLHSGPCSSAREPVQCHSRQAGRICRPKGCRGSPRCHHPWWFDIMCRGKRWRMRVDDFAIARGATAPITSKQTAGRVSEPKFVAEIMAGRDPHVAPTAQPVAEHLTVADFLDCYCKDYVEAEGLRSLRAGGSAGAGTTRAAADCQSFVSRVAGEWCALPASAPPELRRGNRAWDDMACPAEAPRGRYPHRSGAKAGAPCPPSLLAELRRGTRPHAPSRRSGGKNVNWIWTAAEADGAPCRTRTCGLLVRSTNEGDLPPDAAPCQDASERAPTSIESASNEAAQVAAPCHDGPGDVAPKGQEEGNGS